MPLFPVRYIKITLPLALVASALASAPAFACQACMGYSEADSNPVLSPPHVPADIGKLPLLSEDDVKFITDLEQGKRYTRVGNYIADKTIRDIWARLLDDAALYDLMRPRVEAQCAGLREKSKKKKTLVEKDRVLAEHLRKDMSGAISFDDWEFLNNWLNPQG